MVPQLTPESWCQLLYPDPAGWINIFTSNTHGDKAVLWARTPETFAEAVTSLDGDVWFGCATRTENLGNKRGGDHDCLEVAGLWLDIDVLGPHHKADDLPPTIDDALTLLKTFPLRPTIVLDSGGGLQAWWLFHEPLPAADVRPFLPRWAATWQELARRHNWRVDNVFDLARVMRVPGTHNHKSDPPRPVQTLHCTEDRRYALDDLAEWTVDPPPAIEPRPAYEGGTRPGDTFNATVDPARILEKKGCVFDHADRDGTRHYRAPHHAGEKGMTGIVVYADGHTTIYSETFAAQTGAESQRPYDPFGLYTHLEHGGQFSEAREAIQRGPTAWGDVDGLTADGAAESSEPRPPGGQPTDRIDRALRSLTLKDFTGITIRRVRWLWDGYIPMGALTLLAGKEGAGKSTVCFDLMASITRGVLPGELLNSPGDVIVVATEDSLEHTIKPRLLAAGADMARVWRVDMLDPTESLSLPVDIPNLEKACAGRNIALIVLDPLLSRLSAKLDSHKDSEVRQALEPLGAFVDRIGASVIGLIHLNKSGTADPLDVVMGSKAFTAFARAVLHAMVDPEEPGRHLLGLAKSNLGRLDIPTLTYTFDIKTVGEDDGPIVATKIVWGPESTTLIADALQVSTENRTQIDEAADWLRDWIDNEGGSGIASVALKAGTKVGHTDKTLRRARERLKLESKGVGFPKQVIWFWPGALSADS